MSIAKKCDRCGKLYEEYNIKKSETDTNGMMLLNIDNKMSYFSHKTMDLCPECMETLRFWLTHVSTE